uniref:TPT domain-containing protein n=1 Tax=Parastrongyloides trichosuri TaxID=131310 RepID=A0A0N5A0E3_PARTI
MIYATILTCISKTSTKSLKRISLGYKIRWLLPFGLGKALAAVSTYFGLSKVPISYAQTVKCTMPIFTVIIARIFLSEKQSKAIYLSLFPIIVGVLLCSATEINFDVAGLVASLTSTSLCSFMNVLAKKILDDTSINPLHLLSKNSKMALILCFPIWFYNEGILFFLTKHENVSRHNPDFKFLMLLLASGLISFIQNICAFTLIHHLTALSYSVANTSKRIVVISSSIFFFRNNITSLNVFGMVLSITGVAFYNRIKHAQGKKKNNFIALRSEFDDSFPNGLTGELK